MAVAVAIFGAAITPAPNLTYFERGSADFHATECPGYWFCAARLAMSFQRLGRKSSLKTGSRHHASAPTIFYVIIRFIPNGQKDTLWLLSVSDHPVCADVEPLGDFSVACELNFHPNCV